MRTTFAFFLTTEAILYIGILRAYPYIDSLLCYTFVLLCFLFGCILSYSNCSLFTFYLLLGLYLTCAADYFLIFTDIYLPGVLLFCAVQFSYRKALQLLTPAYSAAGHPFFAFPCFVILSGALLYLLCSFDLIRSFVPLFLSGMLYLCISLSNLRTAFAPPDSCHEKEKQQKRLAFGLLLLLLCDIHVGLSFLFPRFPGFASGIWVFYPPSLTLIVSTLKL